VTSLAVSWLHLSPHPAVVAAFWGGKNTHLQFCWCVTSWIIPNQTSQQDVLTQKTCAKHSATERLTQESDDVIRITESLACNLSFMRMRNKVKQNQKLPKSSQMSIRPHVSLPGEFFMCCDMMGFVVITLSQFCSDTMHVKHFENQQVKPAGIMQTKRTKNQCDFDLWPMTFKLNGILEVVEVHVHAKFYQAKWVIVLTNCYTACRNGEKFENRVLWP